MIKDLNALPQGIYVADFRYDEGFRVRDDGVCPCLSTPTGGGASQSIYVIEVTDENQASD